jgi:hypothetical protein
MTGAGSVKPEHLALPIPVDGQPGQMSCDNILIHHCARLDINHVHELVYCNGAFFASGFPPFYPERLLMMRFFRFGGGRCIRS